MLEPPWFASAFPSAGLSVSRHLGGWSYPVGASVLGARCIRARSPCSGIYLGPIQTTGHQDEQCTARRRYTNRLSWPRFTASALRFGPPVYRTPHR